MKSSFDWFLFENVEGFAHFEEGKIQHLVEQRFSDMGYLVFPKVLWASDYGVPQHRNRFFMVGNRLGIKFEYPEPFGTKITVNDAIGDLHDLTNGQQVDTLSYKLPANKASKYARIMRKGSKRSRQNYVSRNADYVIERYHFIAQARIGRLYPMT